MRLESSIIIEKKEDKKEMRRLKNSKGFTLGKILIFLVALVMLTSFVWADTNGVWHDAQDVRPGIFGADENPGNFIFNDTLEFASNGMIDMGGNNIKEAKYIYGNRFYDRDNSSYVLEPSSNSNLDELTLTGVLRMNDNNVGGKNAQGVRKVNFENHEWGHFSCSDNDDVAGSLFYDRSEGIALCRKGNIEELANKNYVNNKMAGISNTNAATECSGNNVFLDGNGNCRDITNNYGSPIHGDLIQSNTVDHGEIEDGPGSDLDSDTVDGKHWGNIKNYVNSQGGTPCNWNGAELIKRNVDKIDAGECANYGCYCGYKGCDSSEYKYDIKELYIICDGSYVTELEKYTTLTGCRCDAPSTKY